MAGPRCEGGFGSSAERRTALKRTPTTPNPSRRARGEAAAHGAGCSCSSLIPPLYRKTWGQEFACCEELGEAASLSRCVSVPSTQLLFLPGLPARGRCLPVCHGEGALQLHPCYYCTPIIITAPLLSLTYCCTCIKPVASTCKAPTERF